jgi:hypothetical protein
MVADQDPGSLQELVQAPLMAVRLGSAHFSDVMIGFPSRRIDGWWECPTVIKVDEITQPWTLSSFLALVEYFSGQYSGQKSCISGHFSCILLHETQATGFRAPLGKYFNPSGLSWLRGRDLNPRPSGYEPDELPGCSTPRLGIAYIHPLISLRNRKVLQFTH